MSELSKAEQREFDALLSQITPPPDEVRRMMTPTELKVMAFDAGERLKLAKLRAEEALTSSSPQSKERTKKTQPAEGLTNKQRELRAKLDKMKNRKGN